MKIEATLREETTQVEIRRRSGPTGGEFEVVLGAGEGVQRHSVCLLSRAGNRWTLQIGNRIEDVLIFFQDGQAWVDWREHLFPVRVRDLREKYLAGAGLKDAGSGTLKAQMPGKVIQVLKQQGEQVEAGEGLVVIEAMKMQNELKAPRSGVVKVCKVREGQNVEGGDLLFEVE